MRLQALSGRRPSLSRRLRENLIAIKSVDGTYPVESNPGSCKRERSFVRRAFVVLSAIESLEALPCKLSIGEKP
ncbi:hypothetical protein PXNS11_60349 [Stutzerimonas xanthomarina]|nr:hypothetical protein PXNS11_60349 [Stutzerimonas xanthomarina]